MDYSVGREKFIHSLYAAFVPDLLKPARTSSEFIVLDN
jgi:hypothetical protein